MAGTTSVGPASVAAPVGVGHGAGMAPHARRTGGAARGGAGGGLAAAGRRVFAHAETLLGLGVVGILGLLVLPLPPFLLDVGLSVSIALSIVVLLVTISARDPLEFNMFPSLLLLLTLLRLALNVSSTRLILSTGHAGQVIAAFGNFVIGGNYVVGLVLFLILVVINFMVITKGSGRIAEVAARFTLDAMPGRQMSIDADLGAGLIDETEAKRRREEIARYADFYGAMDGAAKFVRGDAVAGLIITAINLVGGFLIGMLQHGMTAGESLTTYASLTVGDGLVTQIPALIVSTAAGMLVTYGSGGASVGPSIVRQLTRNRAALWTAAGMLVALGLVPGLPTLPFLALGGTTAALAWSRGRAPQAGAEGGPGSSAAAEANAAASGPALTDVLAVEPLELEIGYALLGLADPAQGGDLMTRVGLLRKQLAFDLGIVVPSVRVRDNIQLPPGGYRVRMRGVPVAQGELFPRQVLALDAQGGLAPLEGRSATDPSFGLPAFWVAPEQRAHAESLGYQVVEPVTVLATHLMEVIREHAAELLSRQAVRELLDGLKETQPALVDDVVPNKLPLGAVHRVLQRLLKEGLPVRDLATILETLSDAGDLTKDPEALTEQVRRALAPVIAQRLGGADGTIDAITIGPRLEVALMHLLSPRAAKDGAPTLGPDELTHALQGLVRLTKNARGEGPMPPVVTPPALRLGVRRLVEPLLPRLSVVSLAELPPQTPIQNLATWELPHAA